MSPEKPQEEEKQAEIERKSLEAKKKVSTSKSVDNQPTSAQNNSPEAKPVRNSNTEKKVEPKKREVSKSTPASQ